MDVAGSAADVASDLGCSAELKHIHEKEGYVDALLFASLRMVRKGLPVEVQRHGVRMLQHLLEFRKEELSISELADLRKTLGGSLDDFGLKGATNALDNPVDSTANSKENDKHMRSLIVLAANNSSTSLSAMETSTVFGKTTAGGGRNVSPESGISSNSVSNSDGRSGISNDIYCRTLSEDYDYLRSMNNRDNFGDMASTINACKGFVEFADSGTLVMGETMSSHQGKGYLLLVEHNIICQAFLIVKLYSWIQQYEEIFPCLLSLLNKIWTLPEWRSKYLHDGSGLTSLFSDNLFLKMVYYLVKFCEEDFKRSRTGCCEHLVTLVQLILPLYLELLQCIHGLWYPTITCNLSEEIQRAKYPDPFFPFECTARSVCIKDEEICQEKETRELLEEILESGYYLIGLCTYINGAFSSLLNGLSVSVALSKYLGSLEFRHLKKLIKFTVIPLVKNCPYKYWKEWVDNLLQPLLRHCEKILHYAWFRLLHHGRAGVPYYFGKLSGSDEKINSLENHVLVEFTREVSGLLEILALTEQNRLLSQDTDSMPSTSLFRYLVTNDCFGKLRMSLFGYFVDDTATAKAIPFCRALVCFAVASNDAKLRIFILDNLLPCLIQCLDNQLPCAIQSLKYKLNSGVSDNAGRDLVVLAQQLYGYMLNSGYVQTQAVAGEDKDGGNAECSFKVWLERQKDIFRVKAYSAAAKEFPNGYRWNWEFEDECQRYLSVYIDMLQEVDAVDDFAEHICLEKESLFQKLSPEFRSKYAISSCVHPFMETISSIQKRKFYSMAAVVRNRKMCKLVRKLITLKPYIKGSDCSCEVVYRLKRTNEVPPELSKSVAPSVELLLHSILFFWEPRFHPMIREAHMDKLLGVVDGLTESECKPVAPIISDFPLHLQPYAQALVETKLKESKYYIAKEQICLHEEFDKYLASGELDAYMDRFMSSKDYVVEELIANRLLPSQFWLLDRFLTKLSFERRAQIVHLQTEICTYTECLRVLFENEQLKFHVQSLIAELEAEGFFDVNSDRVNWGKIYFAELIDKFSSEVFAGNSLPKHYAIRGLIDCRTILAQKDVNWQEAFEKVVVDACNDFIGYLPKFWKDTRYYEHQYYALVRDPLKQVCAQLID